MRRSIYGQKKIWWNIKKSQNVKEMIAYKSLFCFLFL